MARYRLRFPDREVDLPGGPFLIGRSASSQLQIEDPVVSRRHARLVVEGSGVRIEDLGSRNGVSVNGEIVRQPTVLSSGDRVQIGPLLFILIALPGETQDALERIQIRAAEPEEAAAPGSSDGPTVPSSFLLDMAAKALSLGAVGDAEWILGKVLEDVRGRLGTGQAPSTETVQRAAEVALEIALARASGQWLDWIFDIHRAAKRLLPGALIDRLHTAVRKLRYPATSALLFYAEAMRSEAPSLDPAQRFLLQRLEGLVEVASAN